jgi:hypothetical protein
MSHVTDIILSTMLGDGENREEKHPNVDQLNKYLSENYGGWYLVKVDEKAGGGKSMQCDLFIAAINHLNIPEFLDVFYKIEWEGPEYVQLFLKDEHDERFTTYIPTQI